MAEGLVIVSSLTSILPLPHNMAAPKRSAPKKKATAQKTEAEIAPAPTRRRQIKMAIGLVFLVTGAFTSLAIISYFFTWRVDQDMVMQAGVKSFVLHGKDAPVANWCGRLGAALSHLLVYRGAGLASLAIGLWGISMGLHIIYGKRMAPAMRYLRWTCLIVLTTAPILAYVFPHSAFPGGGALGTEAIAYSNGLMGQAGTGLVLLALAGFVLFVIFALDVSPMI